MTRSKLRAAIAAYLITLGFLHTTYAATLEWMRTLGTSQDDVSYGISADGLGGIYITGMTGGSLGGPSLGMQDAFVSKYDAAGNLHWTTQFGTPADDFGFSVSSDPSGNVFVAGQNNERDPVTGSTIHAFVTNFDASGQVRWTKDIRTPAFGSVEAHGVSTDALGNVYVTGRILSATIGTRLWDVFVSKFDSGGSLSWTKIFGNGYSDAGTSVSTDGAGNLYVGGVVLDLGGLVSKYNRDGVLEWSKTYNFSSGANYITSVSPDRLGSEYFVGGYYSPYINGPGDRQFIGKYDSTGSLSWVRQLEPVVNDLFSRGTESESSLEVTADGLGNAYVTGNVYVSRPGQSGYIEAFISKYDALGNHLETTMLGNGSCENAGLGIVADGLGNVYITGETRAILSSGSSARGDANAFIAKFRDEAVPEPAGIVPAVVGLLIVAMRRRRDSRRAVWR